MKSLICLTVLLSVASMSKGADLFNFGGIVKQATDIMKQGVDMGMQVFNQAMSSIPFKETLQSAQEIMEAAAETATDYPQKMMEMFQKGAEEAAKLTEGAAGMAEGAVGQTQQMFMEAVKQVQNLQSMGAPKADYVDLLQKMQGTINIGMVTSEPFLGLLQQAVSEAQLMMRNEGPLMQGINHGLKVLKGEDDQNVWQSELKSMLLRALRQSRGKNRTLFLKALTSFAILQKRSASREEFVAAMSHILGDLWNMDMVKDLFGGEGHPVVYVVKGALEIIHRHYRGSMTSTEDGVSILNHMTNN